MRAAGRHAVGSRVRARRRRRRVGEPQPGPPPILVASAHIKCREPGGGVAQGLTELAVGLGHRGQRDARGAVNGLGIPSNGRDRVAVGTVHSDVRHQADRLVVAHREHCFADVDGPAGELRGATPRAGHPRRAARGGTTRRPNRVAGPVRRSSPEGPTAPGDRGRGAVHLSRRHGPPPRPGWCCHEATRCPTRRGVRSAGRQPWQQGKPLTTRADR